MKPPHKKPAGLKPVANGAGSAVQARFQEGLALHQKGRLAEAQGLYQKVLKMQPRHFEALYLSGVIAAQTNDPLQAVELFGRAIAINPDFVVAHYNRGVTLQVLNRHDEALESYERAVGLKPDHAEALCNRGNALLELKRRDEALESYERALKLKPDYAEALSNRANVLLELQLFDAALESCERALRIKPDYAEALSNRGNALRGLRRHDEALGSYERALKLKPDYAQALSNRGVALQELMRLDEALESHERAVMLKPGYAEAHYNRGVTLREMQRLDETQECYERALKIKPDYAFLYGIWLFTKAKICNWGGAEKQFAELFEKIRKNEKVTPPFPVLAFTDSLPLQRKAAEILVGDKHPASPALAAMPKKAGHEKIRIGYYSADFHNHATAYLMAELFERHDRTRFELVAFSFGPDKSDEMRKRVSAAFDRFIDVRNESDKDIALLSRNIGIDIAVDLKGFTQDMRVGIFSYRAAPLQVNYLGYPGTMGAGYIDYLIGDGTLIPETSREQYSEKIVYLPNSYQVNDRKRAIAERTFTRKELGLPDVGFVFCCFNNNYKITPATFDGWMRILNRVEGSVLWLLEDNATAAGNLRKEAGARGVDAARLIFAGRMPLAEHLARHRAADLFLDTLPCNAHTTASDALWAGLPVLTCMGEAFASRVAASLLKAIDLAELVTTTQEQYEVLAVDLAANPERLGQIKLKLERNRLTTPLFDTALFTRHLEAAYTQMVERYQADLPPGHIFVGQ